MIFTAIQTPLTKVAHDLKQWLVRLELLEQKEEVPALIQQDLEGGLALFKDQSFDTVVLSQTLQTIHQTERILREVVRVGKQCVVSFPNFGHWSHRYAVALGRMPVSKSLPYEWFNTPNVRVLTIADFEALAHKLGIEILGRVVLHHGKTVHWLPNLFGSLAIYRVRGAK